MRVALWKCSKCDNWQRAGGKKLLQRFGGLCNSRFRQSLSEFSEDVMSICNTNHDLGLQMTKRFREKYGYFMVHEALEYAVGLGASAEAMEIAVSATQLRLAIRCPLSTSVCVF